MLHFTVKDSMFDYSCFGKTHIYWTDFTAKAIIYSLYVRSWKRIPDITLERIITFEFKNNLLSFHTVQSFMWYAFTTEYWDEYRVTFIQKLRPLSHNFRPVGKTRDNPIFYKAAKNAMIPVQINMLNSLGKCTSMIIKNSRGEVPLSEWKFIYFWVKFYPLSFVISW